MNGNTPSGPGHRPGLPGGGPGAGLVPRLRGAAPAPAPAGRPGGHGARPGAGGRLWIVGGSFFHLGRGFPLPNGSAGPGRRNFWDTFPQSGLLLGKMAGLPGHPNGDGGPAGAGPRPGRRFPAGRPGPGRAGAPSLGGLLSAGLSAHPAGGEDAPPGALCRNRQASA